MRSVNLKKDLWEYICIDQIHKSVLGIHVSEERNMFVAENFIHSLVDIWQTHCIHRWGYVVSSCVQLFAFET
jgi:hypothetical protein